MRLLSLISHQGMLPAHRRRRRVTVIAGEIFFQVGDEILSAHFCLRSLGHFLLFVCFVSQTQANIPFTPPPPPPALNPFPEPLLNNQSQSRKTNKSQLNTGDHLEILLFHF